MAPSRALPLLAQHLRSSPRRLATALAPRTFSTTSSAQLAPHRSCLRRPALSSPSTIFTRRYATAPVEAPDYLNEKELHIFNKIQAELQPVKLEVQDISGGCGSMYALQIESAAFNGLSVIKQHKMVNEVLKEEIKGWHGVQLRTKAAS